jgi:hypothetical protein
MAFLKYAAAAVVKPIINLSSWDSLVHQNGAPFDKTAAARVALEQYDPSEFLLTHCTIVASVDTENSTLPLGKSMFDGFQVDRRWSDWLVTPKTAHFSNSNNDAWERKLLLSCYKTFIGAQNYVEHLQVPELSKGRIIDAAARDIGDSVYVDILVATARKHKPLVASITDGRLQTLSMGCSIAFSICSRCGNVAEDEASKG